MKFALIAIAVVLLSQTASAQVFLPNPTAEESSAPRPPRARGISVDLGVAAAQGAVAVCHANGYRTTALVVDSAGIPIAMVSDDNAAAITQRIAMGKALVSLRSKMDSGGAAARAKTDTTLAASIADLGVARPGAIPITIGQDVVGAIAVSGSPGGDKDEVCARAALALIQDRLK